MSSAVYDITVPVMVHGLNVMDDEDMPPRRILNPEYAIHTFDPDGELVAMSRTTLSYVNTSEW